MANNLKINSKERMHKHNMMKFTFVLVPSSPSENYASFIILHWLTFMPWTRLRWSAIPVFLLYAFVRRRHDQLLHLAFACFDFSENGEYENDAWLTGWSYNNKCRGNICFSCLHAIHLSLSWPLQLCRTRSEGRTRPTRCAASKRQKVPGACPRVLRLLLTRYFPK